MKQLFALLMIALMCTSAAYAEKVCGVDDGDTLRLCSGKKVRLHGIDAPELHQPFGPAARDTLKEMVMDKDVQLNCYERGWLRDMCNVSLEGKDIQAELVRTGLAFDYPYYSHGKYTTEQSEARKDKTGVWMQSEGSIKTWDLRRHK